MADSEAMCTVVVSLDPDGPVPLLLLGIRDEFTGRPWRPPWDEQPDDPRGTWDEQPDDPNEAWDEQPPP